MQPLNPETPIEAITVAPAQCRDCPTFAGIAAGFQSLRRLDFPVAAADVADLAAVACGSCAGRYPRVQFDPNAISHTGEVVTYVWLTLRPADNDDDPTVFGLEPQQQEPSP